MALIMFDMDGTFMSSRPFHAKVFHRFLNRHGHPLTLEEARDRMGATVRDIFTQCGVVEEEMEELYAKLDEFVQSGIDDLVREIPEAEGIHEAMAAIKASGAHTAVVTNSMQYVAERMLTLHGLRPFFDVVSGADPHSVDKVARFEAVIEHFKAEREKVIYIGDTEGDIELAHKVGCLACFAKTPISWYQNLDYINAVLRPEYTFESFYELPGVLGLRPAQ